MHPMPHAAPTASHDAAATVSSTIYLASSATTARATAMPPMPHVASTVCHNAAAMALRIPTRSARATRTALALGQHAFGRAIPVSVNALDFGKNFLIPAQFTKSCSNLHGLDMRHAWPSSSSLTLEALWHRGRRNLWDLPPPHWQAHTNNHRKRLLTKRKKGGGSALAVSWA
jgi:hypothetical protein